MSVEVAVVVASVTKTTRKVSPAVSPAGVLITRPATARLPPPKPKISTAVATVSLRASNHMMDLQWAAGQARKRSSFRRGKTFVRGSATEGRVGAFLY